MYTKFAHLTFSNENFFPNHCLPHRGIKCFGVMVILKHAYNRNIIKVAIKVHRRKYGMS